MKQKGCRSFAGIVNFVSIFCPELQNLLKSIYKLMKKGRPFIWGEEQQKAFDEIKSRLLNPPILSMPEKRGRFLLYSDTSKHATGSALYQVQNGKPSLIAYSSKRMPEAVRKLLHYRIRNVWLSHQHCEFCTPTKKSRFQCHSQSFGNNSHNEKQGGTSHQ